MSDSDQTVLAEDAFVIEYQYETILRVLRGPATAD
jgi:hypothetical protein